MSRRAATKKKKNWSLNTEIFAITMRTIAPILGLLIRATEFHIEFEME